MVAFSAVPALADMNIGTAGPLSNAEALFGNTWQNGMQLAIDQANAAGGVNGQKLVLQRQTIKASRRAHDRRLSTCADRCCHRQLQQWCDDLIGVYNGGMPGDRTRSHGQNTTIFRLANDFMQGGAPATYALKTLGAKTAAVVHDKQAFGQGVADVFKGDFEKGGAASSSAHRDGRLFLLTAQTRTGCGPWRHEAGASACSSSWHLAEGTFLPPIPSRLTITTAGPASWHAVVQAPPRAPKVAKFAEDYRRRSTRNRPIPPTTGVVIRRPEGAAMSRHRQARAGNGLTGMVEFDESEIGRRSSRCEGSSSAGKSGSDRRRSRRDPLGSVEEQLIGQRAQTISSQLQDKLGLLQQLVNALTIGAIYALIALGYTMVYGVLRLINFAHSELFMSGAHVAFFLLAAASAFWGGAAGAILVLLVFVATFAIVGLLGVGIEATAYRPLRHVSRLAPMLSALGVAIVVQNAVMLFVSRRPLPFQALLPPVSFDIASAVVTVNQIFILVFSVLLMAGLSWFVNATTFGVRIRAIEMQTAQLPASTSTRDQLIFHRARLGAVAGILAAMALRFIVIVGAEAFRILQWYQQHPRRHAGGFLLDLKRSAPAVAVGGRARRSNTATSFFFGRNSCCRTVFGLLARS
jgi:branched-chain amino acid transport system permease protein